MDRYIVLEYGKKGAFGIFDTKRDVYIGNPIVFEKQAISIAQWLNASNLDLK